MFMHNRRLILVLFFLSCLFLTMSFVSADDNITDDGLEVTDCDDSLISLDYLGGNNRVNSFKNLQNLINNSISHEINLYKDYTYDNNTDSSFTEGILINKSVVINGNGHIIDAQNKSRIFNITADNVIIRNISFVNANCFPIHERGIIVEPIIFEPIFSTFTHGHQVYNSVAYKSGNFQDIHYQTSYGSLKGGAIYCSGNNLKIVNSSFINNNAQAGGAIYMEGVNSQLIDLLFINNTAWVGGGTIFNQGRNTFISQSQFYLTKTQYWQYGICSNNDINIQDCNFTYESYGVLFCGGDWKMDNMNSTYFDSFVKFGYITFRYNLTHLHDDYYNLKIVFGLPPICNPIYDFRQDTYGYSVNRVFCLDIDGEIYYLKTDAKSQADLNLKLNDGIHFIKVYNPITNLSISNSFNVSKSLNDNNSGMDKIIKFAPKLIAKNKIFNKKTKIKKYFVVLKDNNGKAMKNKWVTLKIKGKLFKAKTNKIGKAVFKIKELNKKGKYKVTILFKGNNICSGVSKKIRIVIK